MLGKRLAQARRRAGLTQSGLAEALGDRYDQTTISAVERGRSSLRLDGVVAVARALSVSTDWLLGITDADPSGAPAGSGNDADSGERLTLSLNTYDGPPLEPRPPAPVAPLDEATKVETVRDRRLAELLAAIQRHWERLGTRYARDTWIDDVYRWLPALSALRGKPARGGRDHGA